MIWTFRTRASKEVVKRSHSIKTYSTVQKVSFKNCLSWQSPLSPRLRVAWGYYLDMYEKKFARVFTKVCTALALFNDLSY